MNKVESKFLNSLFFKGDSKKSNGAPFTIKSKKTGKDYTFKISQMIFNGNPYLHVKVENGYLNFSYLGYYRDGKLFKRDKATGKLNQVESQSANAVAWLLKLILSEKYNTIDTNVEIYHLGSCLKCGKTLTDSFSIETGFGPVCRTS
jgi:hypothetical protein